MRHSVIIPLYNKRAYIGETIASLAAQEKAPHEIIIVDDASTDDSAEAAEHALRHHAQDLSHTRSVLLRLPRNSGPGAARNAGLALAGGELVSFLDADDCYRPDCLRLLEQKMNEHRLDLAVLGYDSAPPEERFPQLGALRAEWEPLEDEVFLLPRPLRTAGHPDFFMGRASNVAARRQWLLTQRYVAGARLNEGIDFWYRVLKEIVAHGGRAGVLSAPLIRFRILADSLSHRPCRDWRLLATPPTVLRYAGSQDADELRLARMLAQRWLDYAQESLPDAAQRRAFLARHRPLLIQLGLPQTDAASLPA